jgi:ferritin-like metal-binding protein YciE
METAREFLVHGLSEMLDAERKILGILEDSQEDVSNDQIRKALDQHHKQTEGQIERLEKCFEELEEEPMETECKGIGGLKQEKETFIQEDPSDDLLDIFTVGAAEKVEHYEIASYNALIDTCEKLGIKKAVRLLQQNLREEEQTLKKMENFSKRLKPLNTGMEEEKVEEGEEEERPHRGKKAA